MKISSGPLKDSNEASAASVAQAFALIRRDFCMYQERLKHDGTMLKSLVLILLFHPGFQLLLSIRLQAQLGRIPLMGAMLRRVLWYLTSILTATEVSFCATFGAGVYFPHPTGIVIGESWDIGDGATIMQGVTLGRKDALAPERRAEVGANALICAGAVAVGEITIGDNAVIGANAVVLADVPPNATAVGVPARVIEMRPKEVNDGNVGRAT